MRSSKLIRSMYRSMFRGSIHDLDDLQQEAELALLQRQGAIAGAKDCDAMVAVVIFTKLNDLHRAEPPRGESLQDIHTTEDNSDERAVAKELMEQVDRLAPIHRDVLTRHFGLRCKSQTRKDISLALNLDEEHVAQFLREALSTLAHVYKEQENE